MRSLSELRHPTKVCSNCKQTKPKSEFYARNSWCKNCTKRRTIDSAPQRRRQVLLHYGGSPPRCACCGERCDEFLVLDHIKGRANYPHDKKYSGSSLIIWIIARHFPEGFRVLCHNCNMSISNYGYCPHEKFAVQQTAKSEDELRPN